MGKNFCVKLLLTSERKSGIIKYYPNTQRFNQKRCDDKNLAELKVTYYMWHIVCDILCDISHIVYVTLRVIYHIL